MDAGGAPVVDLLTGRVVGSAESSTLGAVTSPDGSAQAWQVDSAVRVTRAGDVAAHPLPAPACTFVDWADDASLLVDCPALDPSTLRASGGVGAATVLLDATTGQIQDVRHLDADTLRPVRPSARTDDGRLVTVLQAARTDDSGGAADAPCGIALGVVTGLESTVLAEVPGRGLSYPGLTTVPGRLLALGGAACDGGPYASALWSVDTGTGEVTTLIAPPADETTTNPPRGLLDAVPGD